MFSVFCGSIQMSLACCIQLYHKPLLDLSQRFAVRSTTRILSTYFIHRTTSSLNEHNAWFILRPSLTCSYHRTALSKPSVCLIRRHSQEPLLIELDIGPCGVMSVNALQIKS